MKPCPCGLPKEYSECCGRLHQGQPSESPEALMRSRYSAFALGLWDYLAKTQVAPFAPPQRPMAWVSLVVHGTNETQVDFTATHIEGNRAISLSECSTFAKAEGVWKYVGGDAQVSETKVGRNDPCPCGSGQKFKTCHA